FVSDTLPATLALQTLAGLALAWQWHRRVARNPLGPPLAPFREFHFGDHWVWAVVVSLTLWVTPVVATLKLVALNLLVALGGLYLVRGVAIVVACSAAFGIAPVALVIGAVVAAVLIAPLKPRLPGSPTSISRSQSKWAKRTDFTARSRRATSNAGSKSSGSTWTSARWTSPSRFASWAISRSGSRSTPMSDPRSG